MMAGFMPLKENLSVQDTFAIKEFSKLSVDVCCLHQYYHTFYDDYLPIKSLKRG